MKNFYVYALIDPRTGKPFYVGKGTGNRCYTHIKEVKRGKAPKDNNLKKYNKIASILLCGVDPNVQIIQEHLEETEAYEIEENLIKQYGREGYEENGILTNLCIGARPPSQKGKQFPGRKSPMKGKIVGPWSEERRKIHSERMKEVMADPKKRKAISQAKTNKPGPKRTDLSIQKQRQTIANHTQEKRDAYRINRSLAKAGTKNPMYGKIWVWNPNTEESRLISAETLPLLVGFVKGRKPTKRDERGRIVTWSAQ